VVDSCSSADAIEPEVNGWHAPCKEVYFHRGCVHAATHTAQDNQQRLRRLLPPAGNQVAGCTSLASVSTDCWCSLVALSSPVLGIGSGFVQHVMQRSACTGVICLTNVGWGAVTSAAYAVFAGSRTA
jgi:hypothetical protein